MKILDKGEKEMIKFRCDTPKEYVTQFEKGVVSRLMLFFNIPLWTIFLGVYGLLFIMRVIRIEELILNMVLVIFVLFIFITSNIVLYISGKATAHQSVPLSLSIYEEEMELTVRTEIRCSTIPLSTLGRVVAYEDYYELYSVPVSGGKLRLYKSALLKGTLEDFERLLEDSIIYENELDA